VPISQCETRVLSLLVAPDQDGFGIFGAFGASSCHGLQYAPRALGPTVATTLRMRRYKHPRPIVMYQGSILVPTNHLSRTHASLMLVVPGLAPLTCFFPSIVLVLQLASCWYWVTLEG